MATNTAPATTLSTAIDEYVLSLRSNKRAANTIRTYARALRAFLAFIGNIQVRNVTPSHVESYFAARTSKGSIGPSTLNLETTALNGFFKYARLRGYLRANDVNPVAHRTTLKVPERNFRRIPEQNFPAMLDACTHPIDRIIVALGIFLLLRASEIQLLKVGFVDLEDGFMDVIVQKTGKVDQMPITSELDVELRRYLTWYATHLGQPLAPHFYLVPAKSRPIIDPVTRVPNSLVSPLIPTRMHGKPEASVKRAMAALGYGPLSDDGTPHRDGVHTLRRSAARALFDRACDEGYDGAGRMVQTLLHHEHFSQTEKYIGMSYDKSKRNRYLKGLPMFPALASKNVIRLEGRQHNG